MTQGPLMVGVKLKEVATKDIVYTGCSVLNSDTVGLAFEVQRTVSEGGNVETVISQVMVPWVNILYVLLVEERV